MLIFEMLDSEGPGFLQIKQRIAEFLLANEHKCVSLVARFQKKDARIFYIIDERNIIWGVFSISIGGQILHCFASEAIIPFVQEFFSLNRPQKLFSIIGEKKYTEALSKIFLNLYGTVAKSTTEYTLMEYNQSSAEEAILNKSNDQKQKAFLKECELFDCKDSDFDKMFPIQKAYELEEVVIDKDSYNEKNSRILLRRNIQNGEVFGLKHNNRIIAKASINAMGKNCVQLGGIYTDVTFRNKGVATFLVSNLIQRFKKEGKTIVLFVKKTNMTAINVYNNCGFNSFADYRISYY